MTPAALRGLLFVSGLALVVAGAWLLAGVAIGLIVCGLGFALIGKSTYPGKTDG